MLDNSAQALGASRSLQVCRSKSLASRRLPDPCLADSIVREGWSTLSMLYQLLCMINNASHSQL